MKYRRMASLLLAAALFFVARPAAAWAAADAETMEKEFRYQTADESDKSARPEIAEELELDGATWLLRDVRVERSEYHEAVTVTRTVTWTDGKSDYTPQATETVDGEQVTLTAETPKAPDWKTETREYNSRDEVPEELTIDGETYKLQSVADEQVREPLAATALFETEDVESNIFDLGGALVEITGDPVWPGYERDVAAYLGGSGYEITGAYWDGDFFLKDDGKTYARPATFTGWEYSTVYHATYRQTGAKTELVYTDAEWPEGRYDVTLIATYEKLAPQRSAVTTALMIGGGVLAVAAAVGGILAVLGRRRKNNRDDDPDDIDAQENENVKEVRK